ncbi:MAG: nitrilase-related carbon-nitrogen hydrolase [Candidatus Krumholzibacteriia bacterium]
MSAITVAVVQTAPVFGDVSGNVARALARVPPACDLAVLPELCTTGYQFGSRAEARALAEPVPDGPVCAQLRAFAAARGTHVVAGLAERDGERLYNSAVLFRPDGGWGLYRKVHLFWEEKTLFDPGDRGFPVFAAAGATIGLMICFDWIFPEAARSLALAGADLICHPANLVLPHCPDAMLTRSLENRVFTITANRVGEENRTGTPLRFIGLSQIVSPLGERLARLEATAEGTAVAVIDPATVDRRLTPRNDLFADRRPEMYRG